MAMEEAEIAIRQHRDWMNRGNVELANAVISDQYFGVFCLGDAGTYETYNAAEIRQGNIEANRYYRQQLKKTPHWGYTKLALGLRGDAECVVTSELDFSLDGVTTMHALVMEVYAQEEGQWRMVREYMEKYRPTAV